MFAILEDDREMRITSRQGMGSVRKRSVQVRWEGR